MSRVPQLLDEVIGEILIHLGPKSSALDQWSMIDHKTLRACCLVSRQFAFWARHILYKRIHIGRPKAATSYLSLFHQHSDMPIHVKILEVNMIEEFWRDSDTKTQSGLNDLATLLDLLTEKGSVDRCHFRFMRPWDRITTKLQISLHRFLFSHPFETIELAGICICFIPIWIIPLPWLTKRFHLLHINLALEEEDGEEFLSCPEWEKDRRGLSLEKGAAQKGRVLDKELQATYDTLLNRLHEDGVIHPEKTKIESLWVPGETVGMFETFLTRPEAGVCISKLREVQFANVSDDSIPQIARVIEGCKDTLESLGFTDLEVKSATSSGLSLLTSVGLPRLRTLSITTHIELGLRIKSVAWYLLHAKQNGQLRFKNLNLIFVDTTEYPTTRFNIAGSFGNASLIRQLFEAFSFFKFEKLLSDVLALGPPSDTGKVNLWFLLAKSPGPVEDVLIEGSVKKEFPNLLREKRITSTIGDYDEAFNLADALSISPEGPAQTRYHLSEPSARVKEIQERLIRPFMEEISNRVRQGFETA